MADQKKTPPPAGDAHVRVHEPDSQPASESAALLPASESSDANVHQLLAQRQGLLDNGDHAGADEVTGKLRELGYQ